MKSKKEERQKMVDFFISIWKIRKHVSEISGNRLGKEPLSLYFHHILPKNKYPDAKYNPENVILLTGDEHASVEADMYKYQIINELREKLKIKYNI